MDLFFWFYYVAFRMNDVYLPPIRFMFRLSISAEFTRK
jgi:hypothetical protein